MSASVHYSTGCNSLPSSSGIEILGLDLSGSSTPDSAFITLQVLDNVPDSLHVFSGSTLLTKLGDSRVNLRTIEKDFHVELRNPDYTVVSLRILRPSGGG